MAILNGSKIMYTQRKTIVSTEEGTLRLDELEVTANGTYKASGYGCDGFDTVKVNVPNTGECKLLAINITQNGAYDPSKYGYDGFGTVMVNVPQTGDEQLAEIDAALDEILAIQNSLIGETFTFDIEYRGFTQEQYTMTAARGMTWAEWIETEYNNFDNTMTLYDDGGNLLCDNGDELVYNSKDERQTLSDVIVEGESYYIQ